MFHSLFHHFLFLWVAYRSSLRSEKSAKILVSRNRLFSMAFRRREIPAFQSENFPQITVSFELINGMIIYNSRLLVVKEQ